MLNPSAIKVKNQPPNANIGVLLLVVLFLLLPLSTLEAQNTQQDVVYLKNGSILRGQITEMVMDSIVKIQLQRGSLLVYEWKEVEKIVKEEVENTYVDPNSGKSYQVPRKGRRRSGPLKLAQKGYFNATETGFLFGQSYLGGLSFYVQSVNGYRFFPELAVGGGIGFDRYMFDGTIMPIFIDVRGYIPSKKRTTGYAYADFGYGLSFFNKRDVYIQYRGGIMFHGGLGLKINTRKKMAWIMSMGFKMQKVKKVFEEVIWDWNGTETQLISLRATFQRITLNFGVEF